PGHTALTRTLALAYSSAAVLLSPTTPCLLAAYAGIPSDPTRPKFEAVLTIAPPPRANMGGISYFIHSHTPVRLMAIMRRQFSSLQAAVWARSPWMPALLNAQSSRP